MSPHADRLEGLRIRATNVSYSYKRKQPILEDFSWDFEPGTMTALTGPSGRGKSTLLYLLGLMLTPTSGAIAVGRHQTKTMNDTERASLRARVFGFVFQDAALDASRTILDNVVEGELYRGHEPRKAHTRARELLGQFGVDLPADRKPGQVSGGQAQRIALCRALISGPQILLADEPTGNLDPESSSVVLSALARHAEHGGTVIVVTHSKEVALACGNRVEL